MSNFEIHTDTPKAKLADATNLVGEFTPGPVQVSLLPAGSAEQTADQDLWNMIRIRTRLMAYPVFEEVVNRAFCDREGGDPYIQTAAAQIAAAKPQKRDGCYHGSQAYELLKATAEIFLAFLCGNIDPKILRSIADTKTFKDEQLRNPAIDLDSLRQFLSPSSYPYLNNIGLQTGLAKLTDDRILCDGVRTCFCPWELIWSYWHEEGMLVQSLNAICLRFQNKRGPNPRDPLANLRLNPLRPLSTLLWGYIQDEHNRLTVARRAYEYDHEYGLRLMGKAVSDIEPVDSRSKFLEAFHNLLYVASRFYKEADDTTVRADAFPLLNALKELHLILAQGAHNQFGDLPWAARVEMLIQKWLLARPEIREFLGGAPMVPYKESWMAHADSMKALQGWTDVTVSHYRDLGVYGEQILLSVRHADWINVDNPASAYNWAVSWRPEIQSYIHSYRAVTGVDMSSELTDTRSAAARNVQPAIHQMRRLNLQRNGGNGVHGIQNGTGAVYSR
jgi:hypothetical protein